MDNMTSFIRAIHPALAYYVAQRPDGEFIVPDDDLGSHPEIEHYVYAMYERAVLSGGHLRTIFLEVRKAAEDPVTQYQSLPGPDSLTPPRHSRSRSRRIRRILPSRSSQRARGAFP